MMHVKLLLLVVGSVFLVSKAHEQQSSDYLEVLPQADSKFKCPLPFGSFSDPEDCSRYYVCVFDTHIHKKCKGLLEFDILRKTCLPYLIAICGVDKSKSTTSTSSVTVSKTTTKSTSTTSQEDKFVCSSFTGSFPHQSDCSKYYSCFLYKHTLKTCPQKELFDAVKKSCQPESKVHCGTRQRPPYRTTTIISTTQSVKEETETDTSTTGYVTDTPTTASETTEEVTTTSKVTTISTTPSETTEITTPDVRPTGPPEHNCDENDLDCIITDTGNVNDWFKCPNDVGSYAHPSSDKLFIFCMNWIPSVKKCGLDLVFSKELSTCIDIKYLL